MEQPSGNAPTPATATEAITGSVEREAITPEQFMAEMEAQGLAGPKITDDAAKGDEAKTPEGEAAKAETAETAAAEAKAEAGADATADTAAKAEDEKPAETKPTDSDEVRKARKIYTAAAKKEAAALRLAQENKTLRGQIEQLVKLRDEDPLGLLQALNFGKGAEADPVKDLLGRIVAKGEKPALTAEERIAALEAQIADEKAATKRSQEEQTVIQLKAAVAARVKQEGERFDLVNAFDAHEEVCEVMEAYHAQHGVPLDPLVAAEHVEKHLAAKVGRSTKFKAPPAAPAAQAAKPATTSNGNKPTSNATGKSETLTNADSGRTSDPAEDFPFDDHDARAKAVAKSLNLGFVRN
jgi:hypothetical protein